MLIVFLTSGAFILAATLIVLWRALAYVRLHPELVTAGTPLAYQRCQLTLQQIIDRYKAIETGVNTNTLVAWQSPSGRIYMVSSSGVEERKPGSIQPYQLPWSHIGGVGVRMQPGFRFVDRDRDGSPDQQQTIGYVFLLLIVPVSGRTLNILIPTDDREDAVDFVAHTLALADQMKKRINVFGFDKPPAPPRQRVSRF